MSDHNTTDHYDDPDPGVPYQEIAASITAFYEDERQNALSRVASLERLIGGYGDPRQGLRPSTSWLREHWRTQGNSCPRCGLGRER